MSDDDNFEELPDLVLPLPNAQQFEAMGQQLAGYAISTSDKIKREQFVSFFGVEPLIVAIIWSMIVDEDHALVAFHVDSPKPIHLLWALLFLKCYNTNTRNAAMASCDEKTFRHWSWIYVEAIATLDKEVVRGSEFCFNQPPKLPVSLQTHFLCLRSDSLE